MNSLRVTFVVANPNLSGGGRIIADHGKHLRAKGHLVNIIGVVTNRHTLRSTARSLLKHRERPKPLFNTEHFDQADLPVTIVRNENHLEIDDLPDADILIATYWETAVWIRNMPLSKGKKVYFIQGFEPNFPGRGTFEEVIETYSYPYFQIGVCKQLCTRINKVVDRSESISGCHLVENAVNLDRFSASKREKPEPPTIGYIYSSASVKNSQLGLETLHRLSRSHPQTKFLVFGAEKPRDNVTFPKRTEYFLAPDQDLIPTLYQRATAWLVTSKDEGFGLPLVEALAAGTPVISTNVGIADTVLDGTNGMSIEESNWRSSTFEASLMSIIGASPCAWAEMSESAQKAARPFNWQRASNAFERALFDAMDNSLSS
ncbi:MAG: glycosyltransferase family 4 protein [Pseudomonadota bacterium]